MQSYRVETTVSEKGTLVIKDVPFSAGEHVEVIVREMESSLPGVKRKTFLKKKLKILRNLKVKFLLKSSVLLLGRMWPKHEN